MGEKKACVFLASLFLIVLFLGVVDAQLEGNCTIIERASCNGTNDYIIFGLSGVTNAHGQKYDATPEYPYVLCCNLPQTSATRGCTGENLAHQIIGLSSTTNAHAESPYISNPAYTELVCFGDLICESGTTSPGANFSAILSLSGTTGTNSHIGNPGVYATKIWCNVGYTGIYTGTYCGDGIAQGDEPEEDPNDAGTGGPLNDGYESCDSTNPEDNCIMTDNPYPCTCKSGYVPFGDGTCGWAGSALAYWSTDNIGSTQKDHLDIYVGSTYVYMYFKDLAKQNQELTFKIYEKDLFGDDLLRTETATTDVYGETFVNWTVSQSDLDATKEENPDDFYFEVYDSSENYIGKSNDMGITVYETVPCESILMCLNYKTQERCEGDEFSCQVAEYSVELGNPTIQCGVGGIDCECWWNPDANEGQGQCGPIWYSESIGRCDITEDTQNECTGDNLFLTYSWIAVWTWAEENTGRDDPDELEAKCQSGENVVPCPTKIQLPFFNVYNLIIVIVIIILIYLALTLLKKKPRKSRKKKKK